MKTRTKCNLLVLCAPGLMALSAAAQTPAGALDPAFNGGGWAAFPSPQEQTAHDAEVQPDGKIVIAGYTSIPGGLSNGLLMRRNPDSSPDLSFNGTGTVTVTALNGASCVALRSDGRYLLGGSPFGMFQYRVASLLPNGQTDTSFGTGGTGYTTSSSGGSAFRMLEQADGGILACSPASSLLVRFLPGGPVDLGFGLGGTLPVLTAPGFFNMAGQADGKVLLCHYEETDSTSNFGVTRIHGSGQDSTFGTGGTVQLAPRYPALRPLSIRCAKPLADGKILLAGTSGTTSNSVTAERGFVLVRLLPDGTPDPAFGDPGTPGLGRVSFGNQITVLAAYSLLRLRDGSVIIAGVSATGETEADIALARFTEEGRADVTFGNGGRVVQDFDLLQDTVVDALLLPSAATDAQKILVVGNQYPHDGGPGRLFMARFIALPDLFLHAEYPPGHRLPPESPASVDLGPVTVPTRIVEIVLENAGSVTLTNIQAALTSESHPGEYQVTLPPAAASLAPGAKVSASVSFSPSAAGPARTATLTFTSATPGLPPRIISLAGSKATPLQAWRVTWFGSPDNSGPGADENDFDGDGLPNFMEYALRTHPHLYTHDPCHPAAPGTFTYTRPATALTDFSYTPESAPAPTGPWSGAGFTSTILTDDGTAQTIRVTFTTPAPQRLFLRLRITKL